MTRNITSFLLFFFLACSDLSAQVLMRDIFAAMPDSVLPLVSKNNRLDCIDFIENNMEAKVRNRMDSYVTLEALTPSYLRFRTSQRSFIEMRSLLWQRDDTTSTQIVAVVQTVEGGISQLAVHSSRLTFVTPQWQPLPLAVQLPSVDAYFAGSVSDSTLLEPALAAQRSLRYFHPVEMCLSADDETLTCTLQTGDLSTDERRAAAQLVKPVALRWDGSTFVMK